MSRYRRPDLSPVLENHSIDEAVADLLELDDQLGILPTTSGTDLRTALDTLAGHAHKLGLTQLDQVVVEAGTLIAAASGISQSRHGKHLNSAEAGHLHLHRNLLLAVTLAGIISYRGDAAPVAARFPKLQPRSGASLRAHTDDETLLLRVWSLHMSQGDANNRRAAAVYAQCDTGLVAGETSQVKVSDIVLAPGEGLIDAPGHDGGVTARVLALDEYASTVIRRYVDGTNLAPGARLTYRPRTNADYGAAAASAIQIVDRIRASVGLKHDDTTSASIWMWRATVTAAQDGIDAAVVISGRSNHDNLLSLLRNATNPTRKVKSSAKKRTLTLA